ncbi:MAG: ABC transporter permease [Eubacteriaceae bacterium]|nr:ABC transporter permease [Eubacteriaceae bacterium]
MFEPLAQEDKNAEYIAVEVKTFAKDSWDRFRKNKLALAGFIFIATLVALVVLVPILSPYTYDGMEMENRNALPSLKHIFGTDRFGRDIFVRIMYGGRISLAIGFASAGINLIIGVVYGSIAGYYGGTLDAVMMRAVDIIYSVPSMLYVILILMVFGNNVWSMLLAISLTSWVSMARQVRAQVMSLKEQEFALAAMVIGASKSRIMFKHLVINAIGPIIVCLTSMVPGAIFTESFLSFVGIGLSAPSSSWGTLANETRQIYSTYPIQVIWPVCAICLTILSLNFIGDGVGEAFQPKRKDN